MELLLALSSSKFVKHDIACNDQLAQLAKTRACVYVCVCVRVCVAYADVLQFVETDVQRSQHHQRRQFFDIDLKKAIVVQPKLFQRF